MLAPLAIVALLIGGTQAALVVKDQDVVKADQTATVVQVDTVESFNTAGE